VVILGAGRRPAADGFGLDTAGVTLTGAAGSPSTSAAAPRGPVGGRGTSPASHLFTPRRHVTRAGVVADNILGPRPTPPPMTGIPRVVFADPEIAAVGRDGRPGRRTRAISTAAAEITLADSVWTGHGPTNATPGEHSACSPTATGVSWPALWAVSPLASEWIHYAALAIRATDPHRHAFGPGRPSTALPRASRAGLRGWNSSPV